MNLDPVTRDRVYRTIRGAVIAFLGAGTVAGLHAVAGMDFGAATPFAVALISVLINALHVHTGG